MSNYEDQDELECPGCGKPQSQWQGEERKGVSSKSGEIYCCDGCASGADCTCEAQSDEIGIRSA